MPAATGIVIGTIVSCCCSSFGCRWNGRCNICRWPPTNLVLSTTVPPEQRLHMDCTAACIDDGDDEAVMTRQPMIQDFWNVDPPCDMGMEHWPQKNVFCSCSSAKIMITTTDCSGCICWCCIHAITVEDAANWRRHIWRCGMLGGLYESNVMGLQFWQYVYKLYKVSLLAM